MEGPPRHDDAVVEQVAFSKRGGFGRILGAQDDDQLGWIDVPGEGARTSGKIAFEGVVVAVFIERLAGQEEFDGFVAFAFTSVALKLHVVDEVVVV